MGVVYWEWPLFGTGTALSVLTAVLAKLLGLRDWTDLVGWICGWGPEGIGGACGKAL